MRQISYAAAANEAMLEEMRRDPKTIYLATDAPGSLVKEFGPRRVLGTPITEAALCFARRWAAAANWRRNTRKARIPCS